MVGKNVSTSDLTKQAQKGKIDPTKAPLRKKLFTEESDSPLKQGRAVEGSTKQTPLTKFMKPRQSENKPSSLRLEEKEKDQPVKKGDSRKKSKNVSPMRSMPPPRSTTSKSSDPSPKQTELPAGAKVGAKMRPSEKEKESLATKSVPVKQAKEVVSPAIPQELLDEMAAMRAANERLLAREEERRKRKAEKKKKRERKQQKKKEGEKVRKDPEAVLAEGSGKERE